MRKSTLSLQLFEKSVSSVEPKWFRCVRLVHSAHPPWLNLAPWFPARLASFPWKLPDVPGSLLSSPAPHFCYICFRQAHSLSNKLHSRNLAAALSRILLRPLHTLRIQLRKHSLRRAQPP